MWMENEQALVEDVLSGNSDSLEPLLRPYRQGMLTMAYRMAGNLEAAKEICQEALIKVFRYLGSYKEGKSFKSWLYRIVMNSAHDYMRREAKHSHVFDAHEDYIGDETQNPEKKYLHKEIRDIVQKCLEHLTPKERAVFMLRDAQGLCIKEAAQALGCSSASVRTHISRARAKVRSQFEKIHLGEKEE